jgi:hypothetical protein
MNNNCENCVGSKTGQACEELNEDDNCPCGICIVKMMCEEWCEESIDWINVKTNKGGLR